MNAYGASPAVGLRPGDIQTLVNAAMAQFAKSQQVRIDPNPDGSSVRVTLYNHSNAQLQVMVADVDSGSANYLALLDPVSGMAIDCFAGNAISFETTAKFLLVNFVGPSAGGVIAIGR